MNTRRKFEVDGFVVVDHVFDQSEICLISSRCEAEIEATVGTRNLLKFDWVKSIASTLMTHEALTTLMPNNPVAVQCNYFAKDADKNWSVSLHRDLSIPIASKVSSNEWGGWSIKEGVLYAQPPQSVLSQMVSVRLHLEDNSAENGALELVAGSHIVDLNDAAIQNKERELCVVKLGGVLAMRPLVLHSSTKLRSGRRRVLHFVFGPDDLPDNAKWPADLR